MKNLILFLVSTVVLLLVGKSEASWIYDAEASACTEFSFSDHSPSVNPFIVNTAWCGGSFGPSVDAMAISSAGDEAAWVDVLAVVQGSMVFKYVGETPPTTMVRVCWTANDNANVGATSYSGGSAVSIAGYDPLLGLGAPTASVPRVDGGLTDMHYLVGPFGHQCTVPIMPICLETLRIIDLPPPAAPVAITLIPGIECTVSFPFNLRASLRQILSPGTSAIGDEYHVMFLPHVEEVL